MKKIERMCLFLMIKVAIADARVQISVQKMAGSITMVPERLEMMWWIFRGLLGCSRK